MLTLYLDSSKIDNVTVKLLGSFGEVVVTTETKDTRGSQVILSSIQHILEEKKQTLTDITAIEVYKGDGSYTGRRVGAAIANTLSYALGLSEFVYPAYE